MTPLFLPSTDTAHFSLTYTHINAWKHSCSHPVSPNPSSSLLSFPLSVIFSHCNCNTRNSIISLILQIKRYCLGAQLSVTSQALLERLVRKDLYMTDTDLIGALGSGLLPNTQGLTIVLSLFCCCPKSPWIWRGRKNQWLEGSIYSWGVGKCLWSGMIMGFTVICSWNSSWAF